MSSAAATSFTCTPGKLLNFTAVALNRSPYFSTLRGLAFATTHLQPVRPRCQLNRGKLGVALGSGLGIALSRLVCNVALMVDQPDIALHISKNSILSVEL